MYCSVFCYYGYYVNRALEIKMENLCFDFFLNLMYLKTFDFHLLEIMCFLKQKEKTLDSDDMFL